MTDPYRTLTIVEPLPTDPVVRALRLAGALPFVKTDDIIRCPFCETKRRLCQDGSTYDGPSADNRICTGKRRWWRLYSRSCTLDIAHFHVRCITCKARWIMAPANVQL